MRLNTLYLGANTVPGNNAGESQAMVLPSTKGNQRETGQREAGRREFSTPAQLLVKPTETIK